MLRAGILGMRGSMVMRLRPCMISSIPPPSPPHALAYNDSIGVVYVPSSLPSSVLFLPVLSVPPPVKSANVTLAAKAQVLGERLSAIHARTSHGSVVARCLSTWRTNARRARRERSKNEIATAHARWVSSLLLLLLKKKMFSYVRMLC